MDLIEFGWAIIANAYGGDWTKAPPDWMKAAEEYRNRYHNLLSELKIEE